MAKSPDGPDYEPVIEDLTEKLEAWRNSNEPAHEFARRIVGLLRMERAKWERK